MSFKDHSQKFFFFGDDDDDDHGHDDHDDDGDDLTGWLGHLGTPCQAADSPHRGC